VLTGGGDQPGEDYRPIKLADTSKALIDAVLSIEDHRFFEHGALDLKSLARAVWVNARAGKVVNSYRSVPYRVGYIEPVERHSIKRLTAGSGRVVNRFA
jgi:hypothetical protein